MTVTPVPFDPALLPAYEAIRAGDSDPLGPDTYLSQRESELARTPSLDDVIAGRPVAWEERLVPGPAGAPDVLLTILRPSGGVTTPAALYYIHGGGMYLGSRLTFISSFVDHVLAYGLVAVSVEYRLAPEHPHPAPLEDCYAGYVWASEHAAELGFEPGRIVVMGGSAGGGLSAGVALLARDRNGPRMRGQGLYCPMIDDRNDTVSARQYDGLGIWDRQSNHWGWQFLLGDAAAGPDVSPYAAPARATDLSGLPPAFIDAGACEVFRDEDVEYAMRIWATGGEAELHVWAGAFHGFTSESDALVCVAARRARNSWLERILELPSRSPEVVA